MVTRKNQNQLKDSEKQRYVEAVQQMKTMPGGSFPRTRGAVPTVVNLYDKYVVWHEASANYMMQHMGGAMGEMNHPHRNPAFGPWHRFFIAEFEKDLQAADVALGHDSKITLPFWDWTYDNSKDPTTQRGSIWKSNFMGGDGSTVPADKDAVLGDPFKRGSWTININPLPAAAFPDDQGPDLRRRMAAGVGRLPDKSEADAALQIPYYDGPPWDASPDLQSFRNTFEGWVNGPNLHNRVHVWVGGSMLPLTSPNDPVFFLHHCNVDRMWSQWQAKHPGQNYPPSRKPPPAVGTVHTGGAASTTLTGVSTLFTLQVGAQDTITILDGSASPPMVTVMSVASDTSLIVDNAVTVAAPGVGFAVAPAETRALAGTVHTNGVSSTGLIGVGTRFTAQVSLGDTIWIVDHSGGTYVIQASAVVGAIVSDTSITLNTAVNIAAPGFEAYLGPMDGVGLNDTMYPWDGVATPLVVRPIDVLNNQNMVIAGHDYSYMYAADPAIYFASAAD